MTKAQKQHAIGISHFFLRGTDGKFKRVTSPAEIAKALNAETGVSYYIFTKDPSAQSYEGIMSRIFGKPAQQVEAMGNISLTLKR